VRQFNVHELGAANDLDQFLFGTDRAQLDKYLPILREVQEASALAAVSREKPANWDSNLRGGSAYGTRIYPRWTYFPSPRGEAPVRKTARTREKRLEAPYNVKF